jgi:hypothetical protein
MSEQNQPTETKVESKEQQPPQRVIDDPLLGSLADDLKIMLKREETKAEPPVAPEIKPVEEVKEEVKPDVKVGVKKREDARKVAEEVFNKRMEEIKSQTPVPPLPPKEETKIEDPQANFNHEQQSEYEDAVFSETVDVANKGRSDKLKEFYKKLDAYVEKAKDDPDRTLDANDEEFVKFVKENKPAWKPGERDKIARQRLLKEAREAAKQEMEPELKRLEREAKEAKALPMIERTVTNFDSELEKALATDDPFEKNIYRQVHSTATTLANDYMRLVNSIDSIGAHNDQAVQGRHQYLMDFITNSADSFAKSGGESRVRDGRTFVTPSDYVKLANAKDPKLSKSWTFNYLDVIEMLKSHAVEVAKDRLKTEEEQYSKLGFTRSKKAEVPKQEKEATPMSGIKATSTPAPGASGSATNSDLDHPGKDVISILGLRP